VRPLYYISWTPIALVAATPKTILELPTPANTSLTIIEFFPGIDVTSAGSLKIEWGIYGTTSAGATAATPQKWLGDRNIDSAVVSAKVNTSATEPAGFSQGTLGAALYPGALLPLPCIPYFPWPLAQEFDVPESTNFGIRLTSSVAGNTMGWIKWTE